MPRNVVVLFDNKDGQALIQEVCRSHGVHFAEFELLVQTEVEKTGMQRRAGLWDQFDDILDRILEDE